MAGRYALSDQRWHMIEDIVSPPQSMVRPRRPDHENPPAVRSPGLLTGTLPVPRPACRFALLQASAGAGSVAGNVRTSPQALPSCDRRQGV